MTENNLEIRLIQSDDIEKILNAMNEPYMVGKRDYYEGYFRRCVEENEAGERVTFIAFMEGKAAGYVNIIFESLYPYFKEKNIPEINDLYVVPEYRKNGIGKRLLNKCERFVSGKYDNIGLGVGLYKDYGNAQRLYTKNGYALDGNGLIYNGAKVEPGKSVVVDDDLLIYLYKKL